MNDGPTIVYEVWRTDASGTEHLVAQRATLSGALARAGRIEHQTVRIVRATTRRETVAMGLSGSMEFVGKEG